MPERCLLVFAKPPVAGRVKTRLAEMLTTRGAVELHTALLLDLLDRVVRAGSFEVAVWWAWNDPSSRRLLEGLDVRQSLQQGDDLGRRMYGAAAATAVDFDQVCIVGSDLPELDGTQVEAAFARLGGCDVVLGPAHDGGYYLVGGSQLPVAIFQGVPWGGGRVLAETLDRCRRLGLSAALLPERRDVDRPDDVVWLQRQIEAGRVSSPRAASVLSRSSQRVRS